MEIKSKKFLVTGGAGFIGSNIVDRLIAEGGEVAIIDNLITGRKENLNPKAVFYQMNIADPKVRDMFEKEKPEYVFHLAFNVRVPDSVKDPMIDMDSIVGSVNILKNCRDFKVKKIIFSSSGFVYGNAKNLPTKEDASIDPVSSYVVAKSTVENYLRFFNQAFGLPFVILRYATVYGPRQSMGAMSDYVRKLAQGSQADIWGDGSKTRDYIFVNDIVRANLMMLDLKDDYSDPVFNVGTSVETTLNELYGKIAKLLGKKAEAVYHEDRPGEMIRFCLDYSKIKKAISWEPQTSLDQGLKLRMKQEKLI